ncbi:hypothetical protein [Chryseobacterium indoltheticum]|uniref:hypothetical protein n=1 Tax=Chryseobacterium indoltheticum TaxID=254 RepID=UPI003F499C74
MLNGRLQYLLLILMFLGNFTFSQQRKISKSISKPSNLTMKAGAFIDVNTANYTESSYSITQLVKDVLISGGSSCSTANVSNVVVSPNLSAGDQSRSWGFLIKEPLIFLSQRYCTYYRTSQKIGKFLYCTLSSGCFANTRGCGFSCSFICS